MRGALTLGLLMLLGACGATESAAPEAAGAAASARAGSTAVAPSTTVPATTAPTTIAPRTSVLATIAPTTIAPTTAVPVTTPEATPGLDGEWVVTSGVVDGRPVQLIDTAPITLTARGSTLSGSAACNGYEYTVELDGGSVVFVEGFVTEIGCELSIAELEETYLRSFGATATYVIDGTTMSWTTPTANWVFERVPPTPAAPLVGTVWVLNGVLYEFGGMSAAGIEAGRLVFAADGTFAGSTGCREVAGTWAIEGGTITTADATLTGECSGPLTEIDEIVARVFDEGFMGTIDGDRLSARPRTDLGLDLFAE